jgi:hypothetical protein
MAGEREIKTCKVFENSNCLSTVRLTIKIKM